MSNTSRDPDINTEEDLFYFETDHLALRGNKEYSEVLKNLLVLCSQRKQAIKDYSKAVELKKEALENPGKVLEKIIKGESLGMPDIHVLPEFPVIDWSKFDVKIPEDSLKEIYSNETETIKKKLDLPIKNLKINNGKWTAEEQKRLEELLHIYPPEPIEMRRFKKIADALGNRTIRQVTSRLQKYFLKLYKAGLPVPGRIPKSAERNKKSVLHKHQRHNHYLWKPTTFFPDLCVPVEMDDLDTAGGPSSSTHTCTATSNNYLIPSSYHTENDEKGKKKETDLRLDLLKRIRAAKIMDAESASSLYHHKGYKCDYCEEEPIVGTRWHCGTCKTISVDFCTDCVLSQLNSENCHPLNHYLSSHHEKDSDYSDSGSPSENFNHNAESCSSSDNEMMTAQDEVDHIQNDNFSNGNLGSGKDVKVKTEFEDDISFLEVTDSKLFDDSQDLMYSEVDNVSYDYLHSNLMLDNE